MNPIRQFKQYVAGEALANAADEFECASINLLTNYSIIGILLASVFTVLLFAQGFNTVGIINCFAIALLMNVFVIIRKTKSVKKAAIWYVIIQQIASTAWGVAGNFYPAADQVFWLLLNTFIAFFILGNRWGFFIASLMLLHVIFGVLNETSGFAYWQSPPDLIPKADVVAHLVPFALDIYVLREFVRTRGMAEAEIKESRRKNEELLLNILPAETAHELKQKGSADAKFYDEVTVLFADIQNFSQIASDTTPQLLVNELHQCFKSFDEIISKYSIEKIKTIGDAYLCASGIPVKNPEHAFQMVSAAREMLEAIQKRNAHNDGIHFTFRVGIHTGPIVAGVVGIKKFAYDIWGDTVNTASRMQQNGEPGRINISEATYHLLNKRPATNSPPLRFEYRGEIEAKNKGKMKMYFVA